MSWFLLGFGLVAALCGGTVAVAAAAVSRAELSRWVSQRLRGAAVASRLYEAPGEMLRTASAVGAAGVLVAGLGAARLIAGLSPMVASLVVLLIGLPVVAMLAYGIPRAIGLRWSESVVERATPVTERVSRMVRPLVGNAGNGSAALTGAVRGDGGTDLESAEEARMVGGVLAFTDRTVRDVMTPRTAMIALEEGASLEDVATAFTDSGYSRLPVYSESLDNVVGMIHAFDLLKVTPGSELPIRTVIATPGSTPCPSLLLEFQRERRQMAVVLDEFGGTAGIVTIEDLLQELVGEIFDDDEMMERADDAPVADFDGTTPVEELITRFGVENPVDAETVGGFVARLTGRIPQAGERIRYGDLEFDVLEAAPMRVNRVVVRRGPVRSTRIRRERP